MKEVVKHYIFHKLQHFNDATEWCLFVQNDWTLMAAQEFITEDIIEDFFAMPNACKNDLEFCGIDVEGGENGTHLKGLQMYIAMMVKGIAEKSGGKVKLSQAQIVSHFVNDSFKTKQ
jgi:hypothetical protein